MVRSFVDKTILLPRSNRLSEWHVSSSYTLLSSLSASLWTLGSQTVSSANHRPVRTNSMVLRNPARGGGDFLVKGYWGCAAG